MITSTSNAKVKWLRQLQKKRKVRETEGAFIVEGLRMFEETPTEQIREVYVSESFFAKNKEMIKGFKLEVLSDTVFAHVSDTKTPQGVLCIVKMKECTLEQIVTKAPAHILILEDIQDPGNLGTIIRSAEGAGVTGVIMSECCVDIYNPKTIRSTMGSIYRMPFLYVDNLKDAINSLKKEGTQIFAADLQGEVYSESNGYLGNVAFLLGNEGNGVSDEALSLVDKKVMIPMQGQVESLNVAIAASVLMFEVYRQRR